MVPHYAALFLVAAAVAIIFLLGYTVATIRDAKDDMRGLEDRLDLQRVYIDDVREEFKVLQRVLEEEDQE